VLPLTRWVRGRQEAAGAPRSSCSTPPPSDGTTPALPRGPPWCARRRLPEGTPWARSCSSCSSSTPPPPAGRRSSSRSALAARGGRCRRPPQHSAPPPRRLKALLGEGRSRCRRGTRRRRGLHPECRHPVERTARATLRHHAESLARCIFLTSPARRRVPTLPPRSLPEQRLPPPPPPRARHTGEEQARPQRPPRAPPKP